MNTRTKWTLFFVVALIPSLFLGLSKVAFFLTIISVAVAAIIWETIIFVRKMRIFGEKSRLGRVIRGTSGEDKTIFKRIILLEKLSQVPSISDENLSEIERELADIGHEVDLLIDEADTLDMVDNIRG